MVKNTNKKKYEEWMMENSGEDRTFKNVKGIYFNHEVIVKTICVETGKSFDLDYSAPKEKLKFIPENVKQVRLNMFKKDSWLTHKFRQKAKDKKCGNCGGMFEHMPTDIALMIVTGKPNQVVCSPCGKKYIELGAEDIEKNIIEAKAKTDDLITKIHALGNRPAGMYMTKIEDMKLEELEKTFADFSKQKEESDKIEAIEIDEDDLILEDYLKEDYGVIVSKYLKSEDQIKEYFGSDEWDLFDCGQGYYQDTAQAMCKIGKKFYTVDMVAEIGSTKQDMGDRLYWVECIEKVTWTEIEKPLPKEKKTYSYSFTINNDDKKLLESAIKEAGFKI